MIEVAAGLAVLAGALLQAGVGVRFSPVCAPLGVAAPTPQQAPGALPLLGARVEGLTPTRGRRRPQPLVRTVATVLAWSLPGLAIGVAVLRSIDKTTIQIALTVAVFASLGVQRWARRHEAQRPAPGWAGPLVGFSAGALTTSTS